MDIGPVDIGPVDIGPGPPAPPQHHQTLNSTEFDALVDFAKAANWDLIFGADLLDRTASGNKWNSTNFESLLRYVAAKGYTLAGWELGNEPDLKCVDATGIGFSCHHPLPNYTKPFSQAVTPSQLAADFAHFRQVLEASGVGGRVIGPDTATSITTFAAPFFDAAKPNLDVFTYHFYYGPGSSRPHGLAPADFYTPSTLDRYLKEATEARGVVHNGTATTASSGPELWVGETSSTYGGGTANASAGFSAGFMWLDKLGIAARLGHRVVLRQVFAEAAYSVLGEDNLPNPDYWSSVLWRRLVGTAVLNVENGLDEGRSLRAYAFCAASSSPASSPLQSSSPGAVTLVVLNSKNDSTATLRFDRSRAEVYALTAWPGVLTSRAVLLNGNALELVDAAAGTLPAMEPQLVGKGAAIQLAPVSYGFIVLPDARAKHCM